MDAFTPRHQQDVIGVLSGFDRMRFRGTLRSISYPEGLMVGNRRKVKRRNRAKA